MKQKKGLFASAEEEIASLLTYSAIFNCPIKIQDVKDTTSFDDLEVILEKLIATKKVKKDGQYVGIPSISFSSTKQQQKEDLALQIIRRWHKTLIFIGKLPFIKFLGISGSIAANNPVPNGDVAPDLDLFVIVRKDTLWIVMLFHAIYRNLIMPWLKHPLCFNYFIDESWMEVHNQNLYTAVEIKNLIPFYGSKTYLKFLDENAWVNKYFPNIEQTANRKLRSCLC